jgi:two-component system, LytTR family, response regulator
MLNSAETEPLAFPAMRVVIAYRESSERDRLVDLCQSLDGLMKPIVTQNGREALDTIRRNRPDVALLACELDDMSGFDVLRALGDDERPAAILVADDERYVAEALLLPAADYVTSPVSADRLALALKIACSTTRRVVRDLAAQARTDSKAAARPAGLLQLAHRDRLVGERAGRLYFLAPIDVEYIEADGNYVTLHVGSQRYINRDSLTRLSALLEDSGFVRISRAILLNLQRVCFAEREGRAILAFVLESGARVVSSKGFRLASGAYLRVARTRGAERKRVNT